MPKVTQQYRDDRRREIIGAALRSFTRKGFHATSMSDIIAEAGLSAGAIYGHFASKDELIIAVASEVFDPTLTQVQATRKQLAEPEHPIDFAIRLLDGILSAVGSTRILVQVWGEAAVDPVVRDLFDAVYQRVITLNRENTVAWLRATTSLSPTEIDVRAARLAQVLTGLAQGGIVQAAFVDGFDVHAYLDGARPLFD